MGPLGRLGVALGEFKTAVMGFDTTVARVSDDPAWATTRHGEYLARMICTECHGLRLTGDPLAGGGNAPSPSLAGAVGYTHGQFLTLVRTGTPRDSSTPLRLMGAVSRNSLKYLTDAEIAEIYEYIRGLPATGVMSR